MSTHMHRLTVVRSGDTVGGDCVTNVMWRCTFESTDRTLTIEYELARCCGMRACKGVHIMATNGTIKETKVSQSVTAIKVEKQIDGSPAKVAPPEVVETVKPKKLSDLIDLSADAEVSKYQDAFVAIMKRCIDRLPKLRADDFTRSIQIRLMVSSQPHGHQTGIVLIGKPDIAHAHVVYLWAGHEDYARALRDGEWSTVVAHIGACGIELVYKANTLKARSVGKTGGKLTPDYNRDNKAIGIVNESRTGEFRGTDGLAKWAKTKAIQTHLDTLQDMYVPAYTDTSRTGGGKTTVTLTCEGGCKLSDLDNYGIKVKKEHSSEYRSLLKCALHGFLKEEIEETEE